MKYVRAYLLLAIAIVAMAGLLLAGCSNAHPKNVTNDTPAFQASDRGSSATPNASTGVNQQTSKAKAHFRTEEERKATSSSINDKTPEERVVYLTIDDGPSGNTPRILEILDRYGIKATWFVKGIQPEIGYVKDVWEKGHQLAIHTYTHEYTQVYASVDSYWADVEKTGELIKQYVGFSPTLLRFPGGSVNDYNKTVRSQIFAEISSRGYHYFDWNVSCGDGADHTADELVEYTIEEADGCHSVCMLMHDSDTKGTTVEALPRFIEYFIEQGYTFDTLAADSYGYHL